MGIIDQLKHLTIQLFPSGRAFWLVPNGVKEMLITGLNQSELRLYSDATSILNSALPDNPNFTSDDSAAWYVRLGLIQSQGVPLAEQILAIVRKMNFPGNIPARQHYLYIQGQLQDAGFYVYVYENVFPDGMGGYITKTPSVFSSLPYPSQYVEHSSSIQHGQVRHGKTFGNKIVNHIQDSLDASFNTGPNLRSTFFIGGSIPGSWGVIPLNRKNEFKQLVLKLKPAEMVAFALINYY